MSGPRGRSGDRYLWYGAVTIGVVGAAVVWTLRLLLPQTWEVQPSSSQIIAFLLIALIALGVLSSHLRTWAVVGIGAPVVVAVAGVGIPDAPGDPSLVVITLGGFAGVSLLVAHQWSNRWMRLTVLVLAVAALGLTLRSGRAELDDLRLRHARATAASLAGELDALSASAQPGADGLPAAAREADDAAQRAQVDPASALEAAGTAVEALCTSAGGSLSLDPPPPACEPPTPPDQPVGDGARSLALSIAQAKRQVAAGREAVNGAEADAAALAEADAALATAVVEQGDPASDHDVTTMATVGAKRLARAVPGIGGDRVPLGLGPTGWGLLGGLLLVGYRQLEILNRDRNRGLVKIEAMELAGGDAKLDSAFRRHVLSNVAEPGAIPGGTTAVSVTDLLGAADPTGLVKRVVTAISAITAATPGFQLGATYLGPSTAKAKAKAPEPGGAGLAAEGVGLGEPSGNHRVFVRVRRARTGATLKTKLVTAPTADLAVRSAGYWGAAYILSRDSTAPGWSRWSEASATALAEYDEAVELDGDEAGNEVKLRRAVALAPASGLLLATLASVVELAGRPVEALELHIRAATQHPRNPQARYRLAMSLSNLAADPERWQRTPPADRRRILRALDSCAEACGVMITSPSGAQERVELIDATDERALIKMLDVADGFRQATLDLFEHPQVAVLALRRSERRYWAPMLFAPEQRTVRRRASQTIHSSRHVLQERRYVLEKRLAEESSATEPERPVGPAPTEADDPEGWQTLYNLACCHAVRSSRTGGDDRLTAIELLERLLFELDAGGQLTQEWVDRDPDLDNLRDHPRFAWFRLSLPDKPVPHDRQEER